MRQIHHMSVSIAGLLRNMKGKKITFFTHDDGTGMNDKEARAAIAALQVKGHKLIPSTNCEGFDPFGEGCPGHEIKEDDNETLNQNAKQ